MPYKNNDAIACYLPRQTDTSNAALLSNTKFIGTWNDILVFVFTAELILLLSIAKTRRITTNRVAKLKIYVRTLIGNQSPGEHTDRVKRKVVASDWQCDTIWDRSDWFVPESIKWKMKRGSLLFQQIRLIPGLH